LKSFRQYNKEFLTETTKYWFGFKDIPKVKNTLIDSINLFKKELDKEYHDNVYFEPKYDYKKPKNKIENKITGDVAYQKSLAIFSRLYNVEIKGLLFKFETSDGILIQYKLSGGNTGSGKLGRYGETAKIPQTYQQEQATIEYFLGKFKGKTLTLDQINKKIGFPFDDVWYHNFEEQYKAFISNKANVSVFKNHKIHLDSGKNDSNTINLIAKKLGLTDSADNWNPADIWIMNKSKTKIISDTKNMISLVQFNTYLEKSFEDNSIIGVSLKKVGAKSTGNYKVLNSKDLPIINNVIKTIPFNPYNTYFPVKTGGNVPGFTIKCGTRAGKVTSMEKVIIYIEGHQENSSVQMGAISKRFFMAEAKKLGYDINSMKVRAKKKPGEYFKKYIQEIFNNNVVNNISNIDLEDLPNDDIKLFKADVMCMYIKLFLSLKGKKLEEFIRKCYYSAMKLNSFSSIHCKLS